jgi:hypothetical protein
MATLQLVGSGDGGDAIKGGPVYARLPARRGPVISFLTERQMSSLLKSLDTLTAYVIGALIVCANPSRWAVNMPS